ncbi:Uncharacterized protein QTN25_007177 [Entamoeba marina]
MSNNGLFIEKQTSVMTEMERGKEVFVVVKQSNFVLTLCSPVQSLDMAEITCELLYDSQDMTPVSYINQAPIKYRALKATGNTLNIECKLNVLSSQHEDHFFVVKVNVVIDGKTIGDVFSAPIRSISKLDPQKKELIRKKRSEHRILIHSSDKKPKPTTDTTNQSKEKSCVGLLALLSSNTLLLEKIKQRECGNVASFEDGFISFIQKYLQGNSTSTNLYNAITSLDEHNLDGLEEISSVVEVTARSEGTPRPSTFSRYPFPESSYSGYSRPPFYYKQYNNYVNPFLR